MSEWWKKCGVDSVMPTDPIEELVVRLCGEIGTGAKHFVMERKGFAGHEVSYTGDTAGTLVIHLEPKDAVTLGMDSVSTLRIAASVLRYWGEYDQKRRFPLEMYPPQDLDEE
jgi:hypothetical protein